MQDIYELHSVAKSFSKAADSYDKAAFLQREVAHRLCQRLDFMRITPNLILDLGCGTGAIHPELSQRYAHAKLIGLDVASGMLDYINQNEKHNKATNLLCADVCQIPLQENSVDLVFSSLMIHWCTDQSKVFQEIARVLRPDGLLIFSSLGPDTLWELRHAFAEADESAHVHVFKDMHDYGDMMQKMLFIDPVTDMEKITVQYNDVSELMRDLKKIGAHNQHPDRRKTLTGKQRFISAKKAYENYRNSQQKLPATYEVIYGHAWGSEMSSQFISAAGEINVPIDTLKKMLRSIND